MKEEEEEQYTPSSGKKYLKETPHSEEEHEYNTPKEKYNSHEGEQYTPKKQYDSEEEEEAEYDPHKAEQADRYPQEEEEKEEEEEEEEKKPANKVG